MQYFWQRKCMALFLAVLDQRDQSATDGHRGAVQRVHVKR
jgi:hypothetical protein